MVRDGTARETGEASGTAGASSQLAATPVLVTGASGFIGARLVRALADAGAQVTALVRSTRDQRALTDAGVRVVRGDLGDATVLGEALKGQAVLFNLAYDVRATAAANLAAFDTLIRVAASSGLGRVVHTSSIVVYDDWPRGPLDETSPMDRPGGSPYRRAKIEMERRLMAGTLPAAILQPTIVWGPGSTLWTDQLAEALLAGGVVLPEPEGCAPLVFVDDLVQALLRAAVLPDLGQERYIISGTDTPRWSELLQGYADILGKGEISHAPVADLWARLGGRAAEEEAEATDTPGLVARVGGIGRRVLGRRRFEAAVRALKRRLRRGALLYPDRHLLEIFETGCVCDTSRARARLGYAPAFDLERGLAASRDHLQALAGRS